MDETKPKDLAYSGEKTDTTGPNSLRGTTDTTESPAGEEAASPSKETRPAHVAAPPKINKLSATEPMLPSAESRKGTKGVWLIAAGAILGLMAVIIVVTRISERARSARETRQQQAVLDVTPEGLITRCGPPEQDVTKDMYPVLLRTMSYARVGNEKIVFSFSRTAEKKSDWVFLSMKDESGVTSYETTEPRIAALPCLDSKK